MGISSLQLDAFLAVAQTLNFTKAAEQLFITQSALSQRVMNLEKDLETTLFIRDKAGLRLTEKAHDLVRYCRCKNSLEEEFISGLKSSELAGTVRIGGFSSVMQSVILPSLSPLFETHSKLKLQMIVDEMDNLPHLLHRGEIDYMVSTQTEARQDVERILLGAEQNVLVQKKKYKGPEVFLDHDENDKITFEYLKHSGRRLKNIERRYMDNVYGLLEGVRQGFGKAVLPKHLLPEDKSLEILQPQIVLNIPVYLCFYSQPYYSKLHLKTLEALTQNAKNYLGPAIT